jgi:probable F420-dependent oxidoreductase
MRYGVSLFPLRPTQMVEVAVAAEELGYDSVWLGEHVIAPQVIRSEYPYHPGSEDEPAFHAKLPFYDPYAALGFLAARTQQLLLAVSVSIVPLHDPYHLARSVATIDLFSEGRFLFGVGAGWLKEEFDLLGKEWSDRGQRLEESLEMMVRLWNDPDPEFDGRFYQLPPAGLEPKPLTRPHPPFIFGGMSRAALRRTAQLGDGWLGVGLEVSDTLAIADRLRALRADHGRAEEPLELTVSVGSIPSDRDIERLERGGVNRVVIRPWSRGRDAMAGIQSAAAALIGT